jgi:hypothetical protein
MRACGRRRDRAGCKRPDELVLLAAAQRLDGALARQVSVKWHLIAIIIIPGRRIIIPVFRVQYAESSECAYMRVSDSKNGINGNTPGTQYVDSHREAYMRKVNISENLQTNLAPLFEKIKSLFFCVLMNDSVSSSL